MDPRAAHAVESAAHRHRAGLVGAIAVSVGILLVELAAGLLGNSVALLADAGHVFADVSGMALSAAAIWIADREPTTGRSFGLYRLEILAAVLNALLLFGIAAVVIWEGAARLRQPEDVQSGLMIVVAAGALAGNIVAVGLLRRGQAASL